MGRCAVDTIGMHLQGWIETRTQEDEQWSWQSVVSLNTSLGRDEGAALGLLFGVSNGAGWTPIAPARGLPPDISPRARQDYARSPEAFGGTWALWSELRAITPDRAARAFSPWIYEYEHTGGQAYRLVQRFTSASFLSAEDEAELADGKEVRCDTHVYRRRRLCAADVMTAEWRARFRALSTLGARVGPDHVRVVVWFLAPQAMWAASMLPAGAAPAAAEAPRRTGAPPQPIAPRRTRTPLPQ